MEAYTTPIVIAAIILLVIIAIIVWHEATQPFSFTLLVITLIIIAIGVWRIERTIENHGSVIRCDYLDRCYVTVAPRR